MDYCYLVVFLISVGWVPRLVLVLGFIACLLLGVSFTYDLGVGLLCSDCFTTVGVVLRLVLFLFMFFYFTLFCCCIWLFGYLVCWLFGFCCFCGLLCGFGICVIGFGFCVCACLPLFVFILCHLI